MTRYAAFLRGVNLGPRRRASGEALRSCFADLGLTDVATFRNSGNVVFGAGREPVAKLTRRIEAGLAGALGFEVTVFLRTAAELRAIARHEPFDPALVERSQGKLQVTLLAAKPPASARRDVLALGTDRDRLAFGGRELYWLPSGMMRDSGLDLKLVEKLLGPATMRTKGTLEELSSRHF